MDADELEVARAAIREQRSRLASLEGADIVSALTTAGCMLLHVQTSASGVSTFCVRSPAGIDFVYTDWHRNVA